MNLTRPTSIQALAILSLLGSPAILAAPIASLDANQDLFDIQFSGVAMEDFTYLKQVSRLNETASQWNTRRSVIEAEMTFMERITLELELDVDIEREELSWRDTYLTLDLPNKWELKAGKMKQEFGSLQSSSLKNQLSPERPMALDLLTLERTRGIALRKSFNHNLIGFAYFKGDNKDSGITNTVLGNYVFESDSSRYWHAGFSFASQNYNNSAYHAETKAGTDVMDDFLHTEKITASRVNHFGPNFAWQAGRFTVISEVLQTRVISKKEGNRSYSGAYIQTSWFLSDNQHRFKEGSLRSLDLGKSTALELVSTFSRLDAYSQLDGFEADTLGFGVNYYLNKNLKLMTEINHLDIRRGGFEGESGLSFVMRIQLDI